MSLMSHDTVGLVSYSLNIVSNPRKNPALEKLKLQVDNTICIMWKASNRNKNLQKNDCGNWWIITHKCIDLTNNICVMQSETGSPQLFVVILRTFGWFIIIYNIPSERTYWMSTEVS